VDKVTDGDTITGKLDKGRKNFDEDVKLRFLGIQAPETYRAKTTEERHRGELSKAFLASLILGKTVIVNTVKADNDDSFGRMLAVVYLITEDGEINVNGHMIEMGYAVPYVG
jgi:micrococcal nuclease